MNIIRVATALIICSSPALALINRYARVATYAKLGSNNPFRSSLPVYSSPEDEENNEPTKKESSSLPGVSETSMKSQESDGTTYPIDLPSPILLSTSMVLAIVGTGSAFDLGAGSPNLGFGPTAAITAVSIPVCLFLFYASIVKATAETEADDKEYMKGKY